MSKLSYTEMKDTRSGFGDGLLELGKKNIHKLVTILTNDIYEVSGKTTFKEDSKTPCSPFSTLSN